MTRELICSSVIDSILDATGRESVYGRLDYLLMNDDKFIHEYRNALKELGLNDTLADDLRSLNNGMTLEEWANPSYKLLVATMAKLRIAGIDFTSEFALNMVKNNRRYNQKNAEILEEIISNGHKLSGMCAAMEILEITIISNKFNIYAGHKIYPR